MEIYHEQQELSMSKQDLVIYPNQGRLVVYTLLIGLGLVLCSGLIVFYSILRSVVSPFHSMIVELIVLLAFVIILLSWMFWRLLRALFVRQPALVVNSEGIQMHAMPGSGNFFISWPEIDAISVHSYRGIRYIGIHPKNPKQYLSRFNALKRLWMGSYKLTGLPPITVALIFLDMPVAEIFQQVSQRYACKLSEERIRLLP
jgi:hypothetical protein